MCPCVSFIQHILYSNVWKAITFLCNLYYLGLEVLLDVLEFRHSVLWQNYYVVKSCHYMVSFCHYMTWFDGYMLCFDHDVLRSYFDVLCL